MSERLEVNASLTIMKYSIIDYLKSRSLLAVLIMSMFIFISTFVASQLTYKTVDKVIIDIGLGLTAFFVFLSSVYWGQKLITEEIERKTVHTILSKGISRLEFFIGKLLSMTVIIGLNLAILSIVVLFLYWLFGGELQASIIYSILGFYVSALLLGSLAVLFSFFMNGYLAFILTLSIFITSSVVSSTLETRFVKFNSGVASFLTVLTYIVPDFNKLNFTDYIMSLEKVFIDDFAKVMAYGLVYVFLVNLCSYFLVFNNKELN